MKKVPAGDVKLALFDQGEGHPVVFAHGFPLDHSMWLAQADALADRYRTIAFDLRGFGDSDVTPGVVSIAQLADDLAAALDALSIAEPVTFVGLSMGGYVAFQFALRHPARLARLVLCDTRSIADAPEAAQNRHKLAQQAIDEGPQVVWQAMRDKLFAPRSLKSQQELVDAFEQVVLRSDPEGLAAALRGMAARPDVTPELGKIAVPTLVLVGEQDAISAPAEMKRIAAAIPESRFQVIRDAGHMTPVENPDAVTHALETFLKER